MPTTGKNEVGLYFHIPFCTRKCPYCHFYVVPDNPSWHSLLLEGLGAELEQWRAALQPCTLASLYFGGGTPSLLSASELKQLLQHVESILPFSPKQIEITLEANPESLTQEKAEAWADLGINRLSLGVQSLDDALLHKLGRTHHAAKALTAIETAAKSGLHNLSIDLMYEIPGQTERSWNTTLERLAQIPLTHLSLYNLTIEPGLYSLKSATASSKRSRIPIAASRCTKQPSSSSKPMDCSSMKSQLLPDQDAKPSTILAIGPAAPSSGLAPPPLAIGKASASAIRPICSITMPL